MTRYDDHCVKYLNEKGSNEIELNVDGKVIKLQEFRW